MGIMAATRFRWIKWDNRPQPGLRSGQGQDVFVHTGQEMGLTYAN